MPTLHNGVKAVPHNLYRFRREPTSIVEWINSPAAVIWRDNGTVICMVVNGFWGTSHFNGVTVRSVVCPASFCSLTIAGKVDAAVADTEAFYLVAATR